ncbi:MAG: hypothetical protein AAFY20_25650 [Cyanobacteria bacterium J06639_14]
MTKLWQLRHGPLNLIKVIGLLIELPLAVPHYVLCAIAEMSRRRFLEDQDEGD